MRANSTIIGPNGCQIDLHQDHLRHAALRRPSAYRGELIAGCAHQPSRASPTCPTTTSSVPFGGRKPANGRTARWPAPQPAHRACAGHVPRPAAESMTRPLARRAVSGRCSPSPARRRPVLLLLDEPTAALSPLISSDHRAHRRLARAGHHGPYRRNARLALPVRTAATSWPTERSCRRAAKHIPTDPDIEHSSARTTLRLTSAAAAGLQQAEHHDRDAVVDPSPRFWRAKTFAIALSRNRGRRREHRRHGSARREQAAPARSARSRRSARAYR